jgi:hypothetical protein
MAHPVIFMERVIGFEPTTSRWQASRKRTKYLISLVFPYFRN